MIPPALRLLMRLQTRAAFRRVARKMRTGKGAFFVIVGSLVFLAWLGPVLMNVTIAKRTDPDTVRHVGPMLLILMCVITLVVGGGERLISFTQGEINFLFPGPFSRRELLLYKLVRTLGGSLFTGFIFSIVLLQHATHWPAAFAGGVLAMTMVQLFTLVLSMLAQSIGSRAYTHSRRFVLLAIVAIIAVVAISFGRAHFQNGWRDALSKLNHSPITTIVRAPTIPFVYTFAAQSVAEFLKWGTIATTIDVMLLVILFKLDADYRDASLAASQKIFDRLQRMKQGKLVARPGKAGTKRFRIPMLPWFAGAGPTAWRQCTATLRTSRIALFLLALVSLSTLPAIIAVKVQPLAIAAAAGWATVLLTMMLKIDFRSEVDQMDWLKALPLSPTATAAGQLAAPVMFMTALQTLLLGVSAIFAPPHERLLLLVPLAFLVPFNLVMLAIDNLLFLLYPTRTVGVSPGDIGLMGRAIVFFFFKIIGVFTICGIAFACGFAAFFASGRSMIAGGIATFLVLTALAIALVPCVGLAFAKFDPSFDTPA